MAFKINDFKGEINKQGGLAQPNKFRLLITGGVLKGGTAKALAMLINQAVIPGRSLATNEIRTHGPIRKAPYNSIYDDFQISVYCTNNNLFPRDMFREWQNQIINPINGQVGYFNTYTSDINLEQYDDNGKVIYACKFIDAFPYLVAPMALDWSSTNAYHNLQVTFAYRKWQQEPLPLFPFGNNLAINALYPNFDVGGLLDNFGVAVLNRADGQIMSGITKAGQFLGNIL